MIFNETFSGAENSQSQIRLFVSWSWSRDHFLDQSEGLEWGISDWTVPFNDLIIRHESKNEFSDRKKRIFPKIFFERKKIAFDSNEIRLFHINRLLFLNGF